jgi:muramoyltetrapeptide carboxypeptidase
MQRRRFLKKTLAGSLLPLPFIAMNQANNQTSEDAQNRIKPRRLREGDIVGIVAPGSPFSEEQLQKTLANLTALGLVPKLATNLKATLGYLAGTDQQRLDDLHSMFSDKEVAAIWCLRGGYGTARLLPHLNYRLIRRNPKPLIGYSDITALLNAIHQETGLVCFHGPVGASDFSPFTVAGLRGALMDVPQGPLLLPAPNRQQAVPRTLVGGTARGRLAGGNLSLVAALCGTPWQLPVKGRILFLEDVGEKPYRIDRMLTQLRQACPLEKAKAIVLGTFSDCQATDSPSQTIEEVFADRLGNLGVPVCYGLPFGHITDQLTLPIGAEAELDADKCSLTLMGDWLA